AAADVYGLPVSTTHVLSSGVAGTMAANGAGLQMATVRNLLMAWVLTLPAAITLSGTVYIFFLHIMGEQVPTADGRSTVRLRGTRLGGWNLSARPALLYPMSPTLGGDIAKLKLGAKPETCSEFDHTDRTYFAMATQNATVAAGQRQQR